jgi:ribose transport system ATP-binding protein
MPDELLRMSNISKSFPGVKALDDVSIDLHQGEVLGILGENGAGKSTLMKILAGDYAMDTGEIFIGGKRLEMHNPADAKEQGIRVIYQELNTLDTLSVAENIFVGALPDKKFSILVDWKKLYADAAGVLEKMGVQIDPRRIVGELSLHEKQIVEIAKALSAEARILVMDEPTAALGEEETESLFQTISNLRDHGVGIIYISHRMGEIFRITDRVTVLRDGVKVDTVATCDTNKDQLVAMIVGRELSEFYPKRSVPIGKVLLEARGLTIPGIIDDVSLTVREGEILGLFGLRGSGRRNIVRVLYGIDKPTRGEILMGGTPISMTSPRKALRAKLGYMPEDRKLEGLALGFSVVRNVTMANVDYMGPGPFLAPSREKRATQRWIDEVKIRTPSVSTRVGALSGGNQQKIVLAKLLETESQVFIMNEPTRGIDVGAKTDIYQIMESLCEAGKGIVMVSSDMDELISMSDRIMVVSRGKVVKEFNREQATQKELLHAATV